MNFQTAYDRVHSEPEKGGGKRLVEDAGYIPANIRITDMIEAGQRLITARADRFDRLPKNEDDAVVPLDRTRNFDMADASMIQNQAIARLQQKTRARKRRQKLDKELLTELDKEKQKELENVVPETAPEAQE